MYFVVIKGPNKSGKSSLALTFPRKIAWMELDIGGLERAVWRFPDHKSWLIHRQYRFPQSKIKEKLGLVRAFGQRKVEKVEGMRELFVQWGEDYINFCEDPEVKTIVVDSEPYLWRLINDSLLQEKQEAQLSQWNGRVPEGKQLREQLLQIEYAESNERMRYIIIAARDTDTNLVFVKHLTEEIKQQLVDGRYEAVQTGRMVPAGWKWHHTIKEVDLAISMSLVHKDGQWVPTATITDSGLGLDLLGLSYDYPEWGKIAHEIEAIRGALSQQT